MVVGSGTFPRRSRLAVVGLALTTVVFVGSAAGFYVSLATCRAENTRHYPSACAAIDDHAGWFAFVGVVGVALLPAVLALLGVRALWLLAVGGAAWVCWASYAALLLTT
jgi:hypothetical protein